MLEKLDIKIFTARCGMMIINCYKHFGNPIIQWQQYTERNCKSTNKTFAGLKHMIQGLRIYSSRNLKLLNQEPVDDFCNFIQNFHNALWRVKWWYPVYSSPQRAETILNKISNIINKTYTGLMSVLQGFQKCIAWNPSN